MLMIPNHVLFILLNLALVFLSKKLKERVLVSSLASWWQLIFLIAIVTIPDSTGKWVKWAILTLLLSYPYCHPLLVSLTSGVGRDNVVAIQTETDVMLAQNAGSVRTRTVASSVYNMSVQASSLIASNVYRQGT
jgi:hypothetical protein